MFDRFVCSIGFASWGLDGYLLPTEKCQFRSLNSVSDPF